MKFIVDYKIYDTEKATMISTGYREYDIRSVMFPSGLHAKYESVLYQTQKGAFFFTFYCDGETRIEVVSEQTAKDWLMHKNYEKFAELYGELEEA